MKIVAPLASTFTTSRDASRSYERTSGDEIYQDTRNSNANLRRDRQDGKSSLDYEHAYEASQITLYRGTKLNILV